MIPWWKDFSEFLGQRRWSEVDLWGCMGLEVLRKGYGSYSWSGIINVNVEPLPCSDFTEMSPPNSYIIILEIVRPRPIPPRFTFLDFKMHPKKVKSLLRSSSFIPIPESSIDPDSISCS